jgi:hypothetical protein
MAGVSSQGTTFTFGGGTYSITSVTVNYGQERTRISGAHMGMAADGIEPVYYGHRTVDSLPTVDVEYITASAIPQINATGAISVSGKVAFSGTATCVSSQVTASVGDLVRGSASFRVQV